MYISNGTISGGTSLSPAMAMNNSFVSGIIIPATWSAADLTFQVSFDGTNFYDLYDGTDGTEVVIKGIAGKALRVAPVDFMGYTYLKVRSGTGATPVNQTGDKLITVVYGNRL